jgi:hypothetical protein
MKIYRNYYSKILFVLAAAVLLLGSLVFRPALAAGSATLYIAPDKGTYAVNSNFTLVVRENSGATAVNAVKFDATYNAGALQFVSADFSNSAFEVQASNSGGSGSISWDRGTSNSTLTGDQEVGRINFKALVAGPTTINVLGSSVLLATSDSTDQLANRNGAVVQVSTFSNPDRMMIIDGSNHAYSEDLPSSAGWVPQIGSPTTANAIAVGGSRMMTIWSNGSSTFAASKDAPTADWVQQTGQSGVKAITVGANSEMMVIDANGGAYAKIHATDPWIQEIGSGAKAVAVGGNGRLMVIDSAGNAYSKESLTAGWQLQVSGANAIAMGSTGRMMVVDSGGRAYYKDAPTAGWVPLTSPAGAAAIAVNGTRMMIIDGSGNVYSKDSPTASWVQQIGNGGAQAIAIGNGSRMMVIDSNGRAWAKDGTTDNWAPLTSGGGAKAIAIG